MDGINSALPSKLTEIPQERVKSKNTLGKDDFLKLLMAQLNNQDPLKPMEHQEFSAQLAQFGSLEQLQNIHKGIESLQGGMGSESKLSALGMIGKNVVARGNEVNLMEGQPVALSFSGKEGVNPVRAQIFSEAGKVVRELDIDPRSPNGGVTWDGKDQDGKNLPAGKYTFRVQGVNSTGQSEELGAELSGRVTAVEMNGNQPVLVVKTKSGTSKLDMAKVSSVTQEADSSSGTSPKKLNPETSAPVPNLNALVNQQVEQPEKTEQSEKAEAVESGEDNKPWAEFPTFANFEDLRP